MQDDRNTVKQLNSFLIQFFPNQFKIQNLNAALQNWDHDAFSPHYLQIIIF